MFPETILSSKVSKMLHEERVQELRDCYHSDSFAAFRTAWLPRLNEALVSVIQKLKLNSATPIKSASRS